MAGKNDSLFVQFSVSQLIEISSIVTEYFFISLQIATFNMADIFGPAPEPPTELGRLRVLSKSAGIRVSPHFGGNVDW